MGEPPFMNVEKIVGHFSYGQPQLATPSAAQVIRSENKARSNISDVPGQGGSGNQLVLKSNRQGEAMERARLQQRVADTKQATQALFALVTNEIKNTAKVMMAAISYPIKGVPNQMQMLGNFIDRSA